MSVWNARARKDVAIIEQTKEWMTKLAPLVGLYADTKVGKTTWFGKLFSAVPVEWEGTTKMATSSAYVPTLYIDADAGSATIGHLIDDERRIDYRKFDAHPDKIRTWMAVELRRAETAVVGAIVIEGVNAMYELELAREARENPDEQDPFKLAKNPSTRMRSLFAQFRSLKLARAATGRGCPIFVGLNVKGVLEDKASVLVPNMSDNLRRRFAESADALLELTRAGNQTRIVAYDARPNPRHAIRGPSGAACQNLAQLVSEPNLDPCGLLAVWADHSVKAMPKRPAIPTSPTPTAT